LATVAVVDGLDSFVAASAAAIGLSCSVFSFLLLLIQLATFSSVRCKVAALMEVLPFALSIDLAGALVVAAVVVAAAAATVPPSLDDFCTAATAFSTKEFMTASSSVVVVVAAAVVLLRCELLLLGTAAAAAVVLFPTPTPTRSCSAVGEGTETAGAKPGNGALPLVLTDDMYRAVLWIPWGYKRVLAAFATATRFFQGALVATIKIFGAL
jgi:hypothetical protein